MDNREMKVHFKGSVHMVQATCGRNIQEWQIKVSKSLKRVTCQQCLATIHRHAAQLAEVNHERFWHVKRDQESLDEAKR